MILPSITLDQPLAILDLETTGVEDYDRIVQVAVLRVEPSGAQSNFTSLVSPGVKIPPEATEVHGIADADVADAPSFREIAPSLSIALEGARWCGYNAVRFDIPMLIREYDRARFPLPKCCGPTIDVFQLYQQLEPRTLEAVYQRITGQALDDAHSAMGDVLATARVLDLLVAGYGIPGDLESIYERSVPPPDARWVDSERKWYWRFGEAVFAFSPKAKGRTLRDVARSDRGFLEWMLRSDFSDEVKDIVRDALDGRFPTRASAESEQGSLAV